MGFSAYILESLKRYGKAEIGPYGVFNLDYQPAQWNIAHQYFSPPLAKLSWSPSGSTPSDLDLLVSTVCRMHEIPKHQSLEFIHEALDHIGSELSRNQAIDLGILGTLSSAQHEKEFRFTPNPLLSDYLEYPGLALKPLPPAVKSGHTPSWLIWLVIAGLLGAFLWIVIGVIKPGTKAAAAVKSELQDDQQLKGVNLAPVYTDTLSQEEEEPSTSIRMMDETIIITGTFCKPANIRKMKEKIEYYQFQIYEEFIDDSCVRLGIFLNPGDDIRSTLEDVKRYIEPNAWILN